MKCRICRNFKNKIDEDAVSFVCSTCVNKKCLERWPYEEFKPNQYKPKTKRKRRKVNKRLLAQKKIDAWNKRLRLRKS